MPDKSRHSEVTLARKAGALRLRTLITGAARRWLLEHDFLEIETPSRIPAPAPESHIDAIASEGWFLQTSPELCMKRLLAAGFNRVFQICKCFRAAERGSKHLPEFTMLEWYRAGADYRTIMIDCEEMVRFIAQEAGFGNFIEYMGARIDLGDPWPSISVRQAFRDYAAMSVEKALAEGTFNELMAFSIEPRLGHKRPQFLFDYPVELGALARKNPCDPTVAERFELYINGIELVNAFSELTDPIEQRMRFEKEMKCRASCGKTVYPFPEKFILSLDSMPQSAGAALGIDRLVMLFADKAEIGEVVAFAPEDL